MWGARGGEDVFQSMRSACIMHVFTCVSVCSEACGDKTGVTWTCLCNVVTEVLSYAFRIPFTLRLLSLGYFGHVTTISALTILSAGLNAIHSRILYSWKICLH